MHILNTEYLATIDIEPYFYKILNRAKGSLACYQLLFDMKFACMPQEMMEKVVEVLDPIDYSLMGGLIIDFVKEAKLKTMFPLEKRTFWDITFGSMDYATSRIQLEN